MLNRNKLFVSIIIIAVGIILFMYRDSILIAVGYTKDRLIIPSFVISLFSLACVLTGLSWIVFNYLQDDSLINKINNERINIFESRLNSLQNTVNQFQGRESDEKLIEVINHKINELTTNELLSIIDNKYRGKIFDELKLRMIIRESE